MPDANLYAIFRSHFPEDPRAVFLDPPGGDALTFAALDRETARVAAFLGARGVEPGDRVVAQVEKSVRSVVLYLACLRSGAVYVPLNTAYTPAEVAVFLEDAEPVVAVCDPSCHRALEAAARRAGVRWLYTLDAAGAGSLEEAYAYGDEAPARVSLPGDLAAILYTSGTTGRSKGAMLSHENLASNARVLHAIWGFEPGDVLLHALPLFHAHGLFVALHTALLNGSRVVFLHGFDAGAVVKALSRSTVFMGVPTHYVRLLEHRDLDAASCRGVRLFVSGSAPLRPETHRAFEARTGHRILERYGMTEAGMIASNAYEGDRVPGSVGFPLPGVEARVVDGDGREVAPGETGSLEIRGPNVFSSYWRMPERTREEFRPDGFFVTGDLVTRGPDGRLTLVGRARDLVISGGLNVYPADVEHALDAQEGVAESAVFGVAHPDFGEGVTAAVVPVPELRPTEREVLAGLEGRLARFKQPKRVFFVDALPRNAMGKVEKNRLRERFADAYDDA